MWLCLSGSFLSVVADRNDPHRLLVRARVKGHIETVFPNADVFTDRGADYFYRAFIARDLVASVLSEEVGRIEYDNFKSSVTSKALQAVYLQFWGILNALQTSLQRRK